jgi:hypothetical protein
MSVTQYADPWASDSNPEAPKPEPVFDPFADDVEDVSGSAWSNKHGFPSIGTLAQDGGHVVILVPVGYEDMRAAHRDGDPARDAFDCELHVLAGPGTLIEKREKDEKTGKFDGTGEFYRIGPDSEYPWPISWTSPTVEVRQTVLVGQLRHVFDTKAMQPKGSGLWIGRLRLVPHGRLPKQLQNATSDQLDAAVKAFRSGSTPLDPGKPAIKLMNATKEEKELGRRYWQSIGR